MTMKEKKTDLRAFMKNHYTDERLAWLLAHAREGKLAYNQNHKKEKPMTDH